MVTPRPVDNVAVGPRLLIRRQAEALADLLCGLP